MKKSVNVRLEAEAGRRLYQVSDTEKQNPMQIIVIPENEVTNWVEYDYNDDNENERSN